MPRKAKQKQKNPGVGQGRNRNYGQGRKIRLLEQAISDRYFDGLPVLEAKENLRIFVDQSDISKAEQLNPTACVYAQACKRLYGSRAIVFLRTRAYVDLPDDQGVRRVYRFEIPKNVRTKIVKFDQTGEGAEGGFLLQKPSPSQTLEAGRKYAQAQRDRIANGHEPKKRATLSGIRTIVGSLEGVRDGRGMVHFIPEIPEQRKRSA